MSPENQGNRGGAHTEITSLIRSALIFIILELTSCTSAIDADAGTRSNQRYAVIPGGVSYP
jgi:hypothetical protein